MSLSLRRRLIFVILLILPLSLLFGGVLTYWHALQKVETEMAGAIALGETTVRDAVKAWPEGQDAKEQAKRLTRVFDGERHLRASLIGSDGAQIVSSRPSPPVLPAPDWLQRALAGPVHSIDIALPAQAGTLRMTADPRNEIGEVWEDVTLKLKIIASFFGLMLALVYWTLDMALRPLDKLAVALSEVGHGNFTAHVDEKGPTELVTIYREFNRMADGLKEAEGQNRALTLQLNAVQEEERKDLARDLHDEIGPFLFAVDVDAQTITQYLQRGAYDEVAGRSAAIRQSVAHMQSHVRAILNRLRPAMLLDLGLAQAVDQLVAFWRARHPGILITADISQASYGETVDEIAFRTVQEAINNAVRHGKPQTIRIEAAVDPDRGALRLTISDDGAGIAPSATPGFGISGMRERAAIAGGSLEVSQMPGQKGVTVVAMLPLKSSSEAHAPAQLRGTLQ
jgi:two-component system sensor histidine kinase UhpB